MAKDSGATDMDMEEEELTEEQLMERCGTELDEGQLKKLLDQFKANSNKRSALPGTPEAGVVVNGYTIIDYLGHGGFGTVCLVKKDKLYFAMKFMHVSDGQRGPIKEFKILHKILISKSHADFLTALEWKEWRKFDEEYIKEYLQEEHKKLCYMVMKLAGPSLQMLLEEQMNVKKRAFSIMRGVPIIKSAVKALQLYHQQRLVHYDVKLDNFAMDLHDENRVILLDYGMSSIAPRQEMDGNLFKGTRHYASRRALEGETQSYRDDCESMFLAIIEFFWGQLPWEHGASLKKKKKWWNAPGITNRNLLSIFKHIDLLGFYETMNYDFVQNCLQGMINDENGIPSDQYLFKRNKNNQMRIIHGKFKFCSQGKKILKPIIRLVCSAAGCDATIYVESAEYDKAEENSSAVIVDTLNLHKCNTAS